MSTEITNNLCQLAKSLDAKFIFNEKPIKHKNIFKDVGLLPAIAKRADQLCSFCLGYGLGISYEEAEPSSLGVKVIFDDVTPEILRYVFILDVIEDIISFAENKEHVELDELLYD